MKLSSKPISSPSRTEKYPLPLMRFLRSNVGNKSRGRSKSSPMFVKKKNASTNETLEPSSPKVTCIGQVRVRRSSKHNGNKSRLSKNPARKRCKWVSNALFCRCFHRKGKIKNMSFLPDLRKWVLFFRLGCRKRDENGDNCSEFVEKVERFERRFEPNYFQEQEHEEDDDDEDGNLICSSITPPKNALLLTRCRSAPYRSSSLATRFWASPLVTEHHKSPKKEIPTSENEENGRDSVSESRMEKESEEIKKPCDKMNFTKPGEICVLLKKTGGETEECSVLTPPPRPLLLTRCKSEPASRTAESY